MKQKTVTFQKLGFSTKVNLLYLLCLMTVRCCLLHLIKQIGLLKTFLRFQTTLTQVSLNLFSLLDLISNCIISLCNSLRPWFVKYIWPWLVFWRTVVQNFHTLAELFNICLKESFFPRILGALSCGGCV